MGLITDCTKKDMDEALAIIEEKALWADKFEEIAQRHHARKGETMHKLWSALPQLATKRQKP